MVGTPCSQPSLGDTESVTVLNAFPSAFDLGLRDHARAAVGREEPDVLEDYLVRPGPDLVRPTVPFD